MLCRFPLAENLIDVNNEVDPPNYVSRNPVTNMSSVFSSPENPDRFENVDMINGWPSDPNTSLDKSQATALRRILTKKVAIVQGPPGTGKTHVSVMALKVMLENMVPGDPPIIVACQTNHALDQLLRHIAHFEEHFARLGGRSKDKGVIRARTLYRLRQGKDIKVPGGMRGPAKTSLNKLSDAMSQALTPLELGKGLLDHKLLFQHELLSANQIESLERGDPDWTTSKGVLGDELPLRQWLGKLLVVNKRTFQPDYFGYEYEEADLEFEQLQELEAENCAQDDETDFESLRGPAVSLWDAYVGKPSSNVSDDDVRKLLCKDDLWKIPARFRGSVYNYLQRLAKDKIREYVRGQAKIYYDTVVSFKAGGWERDAILLRQLGIKSKLASIFKHSIFVQIIAFRSELSFIALANIT
jgi:helicase required for RNAi-mediated heterochromatin assembly 1